VTNNLSAPRGRSDVERTHLHPQLPLERLCTHHSARSQLAFAQQAREALPVRPDLACEVGAHGLVLYAETESALDRPLALLQDLYADQLRVGPLTIRYRGGDVRQEPHMGVRVMCAARHFEAICHDLSARGAHLLDVELRPPVGVVRASAPLSKLIGYSKSLAEVTSASAQEVMWLSHYAPCESASGRDVHEATLR
jgi:hypothetical protein